ncbi:MAG: ATP-binding protein [Candidatus Zixiibacteriota bacterium]
MRLAVGRKFSVAVTIFAALILIIFNISLWYQYTQLKNFLETRISEEIESLAKSTANRLDPYILRDIISGEYLLEDYSDLVNQLNEVSDAGNLLSLDVFDINGRNLLEQPESGHEEEILNLTEFTSAQAGITGTTPLFRSDSLYLLTAFVPVFDLNDSVVAILRAEAGYAVFQTIDDFKRNIIVVSMGSVIFMILILIFFVMVNRRLISAQHALLRASAISSMGEMAATIAHEIRNPLGIIKNSAERIKRKYGAESDDPVFEFISDEVDRLNAVVAGYLDFAHPVKNKQEEFCIREMIETLVEQTRTDFQESRVGITAVYGSDEGDFRIVADRFSIRQALLNLMLNARDAQPNGGQLDITVTGTGKSGTREIQIVMADQGAGISAGILDRVFDPFFTTREKGSGLGLYVVKSVIEAHSGTISIKPGDNGGAVVTVILPAKG